MRRRSFWGARLFFMSTLHATLVPTAEPVRSRPWRLAAPPRTRAHRCAHPRSSRTVGPGWHPTLHFALACPASLTLAAAAAAARCSSLRRRSPPAEDRCYRSTFRSPTSGVEMTRAARLAELHGSSVLVRGSSPMRATASAADDAGTPASRTLEPLRAYVDRNVAALREAGVRGRRAGARIRRGGWCSRATDLLDKKRRLRQAYFVPPPERIALLVLSLSAPIAAMPRAGKAFTDAIRRVFTPPAEPATPTAAPPADASTRRAPPRRPTSPVQETR